MSEFKEPEQHPLGRGEADHRNADNEMIRREDTQRRHNARITSLVTFTSTFVAVVAAAAAVWSGYESHRSRIDDERPYVAVEGISGPDTVKLNSFGKTPALNVQLLCMGQDEAHWGALSNIVPLRLGTLMPSQSMIAFCIPKESVASNVYSAFGTVSYEDFNGTHYLTPFCFLAGGDPKAKPRVASDVTCDNDSLKSEPAVK